MVKENILKELSLCYKQFDTEQFCLHKCQPRSEFEKTTGIKKLSAKDVPC